MKSKSLEMKIFDHGVYSAAWLLVIAYVNLQYNQEHELYNEIIILSIVFSITNLVVVLELQMKLNKVKQEQ